MQLGRCFTAQRALALTLGWVALLALTGSTDALLFVAPALLIAFPLCFGLYAGEDLVVRLASRGRARRRRPIALPAEPPVLAVPRRPRAGLIALSLAKRPPPGPLPLRN